MRDRQLYTERRAAPHHALDRDRAFERIDQPVRDIQPQPDPAYCAKEFPRRNNSKIVGSISGAMPTPVSLTLRAIPSTRGRTSTVMVPSSVNLTALSIRFLSTTFSFARSVYSTGRSSATRQT